MIHRGETMEKKICILLETEEDGSLKESGYELMNEAASLSLDFEAQVTGILLGKGTGDVLSECRKFGIGKLHVCDARIDPVEIDACDRTLRLLCGIVDAERPAAFLVGENHIGMPLASFLAAFHAFHIVSNAQRISFRAGTFQVEKPVCNGRLLKTLKYPADRRIAVLFRPGVLGVGNPVKGTANITVEEPGGTPERSIPPIRHDNVNLERTYRIELTDRITEADVVIGVGGGVENPETMEEIVAVARRLNAAVGGTRVAVDRCIVPYGQQIGQTGKTIAPKVYIALGVSGAVQHTVGIRNSKFIIAVNKDKGAPIMKMADLPCVSDIGELLPVLRKMLDPPA